MESSACSTPWARRCLAARPPSAEDSPTPSTRKLSSSRLPSSSSPTSRSWSPYTTSAAWSARRWSAGFPWGRTAAGRKSKVTGRKWRNRRGRRSAGGTRCSSPNGYGGSLQVLGPVGCDPSQREAAIPRQALCSARSCTLQLDCQCHLSWALQVARPGKQVYFLSLQVALRFPYPNNYPKGKAMGKPTESSLWALSCSFCHRPNHCSLILMLFSSGVNSLFLPLFILMKFANILDTQIAQTG